MFVGSGLRVQGFHCPLNPGAGSSCLVTSVMQDLRQTLPADGLILRKLF